MWFNLVFETPADHPRITEFEKHYIETEIAKQSKPGTKVIMSYNQYLSWYIQHKLMINHFNHYKVFKK